MSANLNVNLVSSNAVKDLMAQHNSTPKRLIRIGRLASVRHKTVCTTPVSFFYRQDTHGEICVTGYGTALPCASKTVDAIN